MSYQIDFDSVWADLGYVAPGPPAERSRPCTKQEALRGLAQARAILNKPLKDEREHDEKAA
jgi:hypothetical protein